MLEVDPGLSSTQPVLPNPGYGSVFMPHRWKGPC